MADLATADAVAQALGLANAAAMSAAQTARTAVLLPQVSYLFEREAQRQFTPGEYTVRLRVIDSSLILTETPSEVTSVTDDDGNEVADTGYTIRGREIVVASWPVTRPDFATVTYSHSNTVPAAVSSTVAGIVARWLRVDPSINPAAGLSQSLAAGEYRQQFASWVTKNVHLTEEDLATARLFRRPSPSMVMGT